MPPKKIVKKTSNKKGSKSKKKSKKITESSVESDNDSLNEIESVKSNNNLSTDEMSVQSESEIKNCELENLMNEDEYFDSYDNSETMTDYNSKFITNENRITNPRLTRYEMVRLIGERTKQLTMGAKPLVKNVHDLSYEEIAMHELKNNMIPFKIKRPLPNNRIEVWEIKELDKKHLESYLD